MRSQHQAVDAKIEDIKAQAERFEGTRLSHQSAFAKCDKSGVSLRHPA